MGFHVKGIRFSFNEVPIFNDLSLQFSPGRFYGILGPNGSGKTTLLDMLIAHLRPDAGQIEFMGRPLAGFSHHSLARYIALVPQDYDIRFPFTVTQTVTMGRYPHMPRFSAPDRRDLRSVDAALEATGTEIFRNRLITELSSGERQRVVFARALAQDTPWLLLDEATAHLDIAHTLGILDIASGLVRHKGRTVIAVFHDMNIAAAYCDELILMKNGDIHAAGSVESVLTQSHIRSVFQVAAKVGYNSYVNAHQVMLKRITAAETGLKS